jgi:hypothetical protein
MICSSFGLFMRNPTFIWIGLMLLLSLFCRKRHNGSYAQFMMTTLMLIFGFATIYYVNPRMKPVVDEMKEGGSV